MYIKIVEAMFNPIRMKIVQEIIKRETATTKEIGDSVSDVPKATLYRHISKLLNDNIIEVVSENKIRGVVEKVYKVKINPFDEISKITDENNKEELMSLFYSFMMLNLSDFQNYLKKDDVDLKRDIVGFREYPMYLSDDEAEEMMLELRECILKRIDNKKTKERKLRRLSTITMPIDEK